MNSRQASAARRSGQEIANTAMKKTAKSIVGDSMARSASIEDARGLRKAIPIAYT
jgi:hypothetical protein